MSLRDETYASVAKKPKNNPPNCWLVFMSSFESRCVVNGPLCSVDKRQELFCGKHTTVY